MITKEQVQALDGHTHGPWSVPSQPDKVCAEGYTSNGAAKSVVVVHDRAWMAPTERFDNARLIAAAPELRETVIALWDRLKKLEEAGIEAAAQLRVIAGMDLIGASAVAYNAARSLESVLKETTHD